ncbi:MAG: hypothetical protein ACI9IP_003378 [Arcticibacterium sp.]|jgi:hypothetical protein
MTLMEITDLEQTEAAIEWLTLSFPENLNEGQIDQIANEMQGDKIFEEYPEIALHYRMIAVNQLLRKAYNGKFPAGEIVEIQFTQVDNKNKFDSAESISKEILLKILAPAMPDNSLVKRLFLDELAGEKEFIDARAIVWRSEISKTEDKYNVEIISSDYWLGNLRQINGSYDVTIKVSSEDESSNDKLLFLNNSIMVKLAS